MLEKHLWNSFLLYLMVEILQFLHEVTTFLEVLYKRSVMKNFSKFTDKHKKQSKGVQRKDVFKNFAKFTEKNLCWSLFLRKLQVLRPATLLRKIPTHMLSCKICKLFKNNYFEEHLWMSIPVNFVNYSRTPILKNICKQLVLKHRCGGLSSIKWHTWRPEDL